MKKSGSVVFVILALASNVGNAANSSIQFKNELITSAHRTKILLAESSADESLSQNNKKNESSANNNASPTDPMQDFNSLIKYCSATLEKNRPQQSQTHKIHDCAQYFLNMEEADAKYHQKKSEDSQTIPPNSSDKNANNLKKHCINYLNDISSQPTWTGNQTPEACVKFFIKSSAPPSSKDHDTENLRGKDGPDGASTYGGIGGHGGKGGAGPNGGAGGGGGAGSFGGHGGKGGAGGSSE